MASESQLYDPQYLRDMLPFATTPVQKLYIEATIEHGSSRQAARALGLKSNSSIVHALQRVRIAAANRGYAPEYDATHAVPDGQRVKGLSSYYGADGKLRGQWVKSETDRDRREQMFMDAVRGLAGEFQGLGPHVKAPKRTQDDLLAVYPMGDPHVGMYSYARETGADFDVVIAEQQLVHAADRLVNAAPDASQALVLSLGDFYHADNSDNRSVNHGHSFDVDTRWTKVMEVGIRTLRRIVERALEKHQHVTVRCMPGNHDPHMSPMLGLCLSMFYEGNPRVTVDVEPVYYWFHRFGAVLIGSTHGDKCKPEALPAIMADEVPSYWGATQHRYWYTGHIHTRNVAEYRGVMWESFRTLAPRDSWHSQQGYKAGRDMYCIVHHRDEGEVERHRVNAQ